MSRSLEAVERRATEIIRSGTAGELQQLLHEHPALAHARIGDDSGHTRSLLHVVTDWPGHVSEAGGKVRALVAAGAEVDARFTGPHTETPLHWAASSDDVEALDALLDAGADSGQRDTAELLLDRGADPTWIGHDQLDAAAAAERSGARELAAWLREQPA